MGQPDWKVPPRRLSFTLPAWASARSPRPMEGDFALRVVVDRDGVVLALLDGSENPTAFHMDRADVESLAALVREWCV